MIEVPTCTVMAGGIDTTDAGFVAREVTTRVKSEGVSLVLSALIYGLCCANVETSTSPNPVAGKTVPSNHYCNQTALPAHSTAQNSFLLGVSALLAPLLLGVQTLGNVDAFLNAVAHRALTPDPMIAQPVA